MSNKPVPADMLAAIWRGGPEVAVETVPVPEIGEGEVLVRVEACGLCPTDIKKIELGLVEPPVILGHEMAGVVVAAGQNADEFLGKRVAVYHHIPCLKCRLCELGRYSQCAGYKKTGTTAGFAPAGGGWAEYVKVSAWIVSGGGHRGDIRAGPRWTHANCPDAQRWLGGFCSRAAAGTTGKISPVWCKSSISSRQ